MITSIQATNFVNSKCINFGQKRSSQNTNSSSSHYGSNGLTSALVGLGLMGMTAVSCDKYDVDVHEEKKVQNDTTIVIGPKHQEVAKVDDYLKSFGLFVDGNKSLNDVHTISLINSNGARTYMQKVKADDNMAYFVCADVKSGKQDDYILAFVKNGNGLMMIKNDAQTGDIAYRQIEADSLGKGYNVSEVLDNGIMLTKGTLEYKSDIKQLTFYDLDGSVKSWKTTGNNESVPVNNELYDVVAGYKEGMSYKIEF